YYLYGISGSVEDRSSAETHFSLEDVGIGPDVFKYGERQRISPDHALGALLITDPHLVGLTAYCVGQLDDDPTLDVWSINTEGDLVHLSNDAAEKPNPATPADVIFAVAAIAFAPFAATRLKRR